MLIALNGIAQNLAFCDSAKLRKLDGLSDSINSSAEGNMKFQNDFFNVFPSSPAEFSCFYAYNDNWKMDTVVHCGIGCDLGEKHIQTFTNLTSIDDSSYVNKLVNLTVGLDWQPDNINFLQHGVMERLRKRPDTYDKLFANLSSKSSNPIRGFWTFCYAGKEVLVVDRKKIDSYRKKYPLVVSLHDQVVKELLSEKGRHKKQLIDISEKN